MTDAQKRSDFLDRLLRGEVLAEVRGTDALLVKRLRAAIERANEAVQYAVKLEGDAQKARTRAAIAATEAKLLGDVLFDAHADDLGAGLCVHGTPRTAICARCLEDEPVTAP